MSYIVEDSNTECVKLRNELTEFHTLTKVFVKAIRRIHHGITEEHGKITTLNLKRTIRQKILDRHDIAFKKLVVGLQDYSLNFISVRSKYEDFFSNRTKYTCQNLTKIETIFRKLGTQRDVIFYGVLCIINTQLKFACEHFQLSNSKLDGESIFRVIETYNKYLIKIRKTPIFSSSPHETNNPHHLSPLPSNSSKLQALPVKIKEPSKFRNPLSDQCLPDVVLPISFKFKRLTASKILQMAGSARARHVTKCVSLLLLSNAKKHKEENGTRLPWKPLIFDLTGALPNVDIFEEAIATEEDECKKNQRKLDMALKLEFGEDFPGTNYIPATDYFANLPPVDTKELDELVKVNSKLFELLAKKFLATFGVLVGTMMKRNKVGKLKLVKTAKARLEGYFVEQMWGPGTENLEEIVLWLPPAQRPPPFPPPALLEQKQLFSFLKNFSQYCDKGVLPESCEASCESLVDECRHIAIMSYMDIEIVNGFGPYSRIHPGVSELPDGNFCTERGQDIVEVIEMLVWQINEIERTEPEKESKDWPIAELIGFILCLGALLGSLLSCARLRASYLLHTWSMAPFFLVTQSDLPRIIEHLKKMKIQERDNLVKTDDMCRIQLVLYREKVVKMIESMVIAVKAYEQETVDDVSAVCRTVSLAQLQNSMPVPKVWRGIGRIPHEPQDYVYEYIGTVLEPVLEAVTRLGVALQRRAGSTILKVVCYAWLEHIRVQKTRFSLWGAQQLLKDFHALAEWLKNYDGLDPEARTQILAVDVLRECEGVARLLMRQPPLVVGYTSNNQVAPLAPIIAGRKHDKELKLSCEDDDIPAEMYVPNQQLWLSLRARSSSAVCVRLASCCSWPY